MATCNAGYPSDSGKRKPPQHAAGVLTSPKLATLLTRELLDNLNFPERPIDFENTI
jgi:hypothetical protein